MIMYTSGATGEAKGVVMTHRGIVAATNTQVHELRIVPEDINAAVLRLCFMPEGFGPRWHTSSEGQRRSSYPVLTKKRSFEPSKRKR